MAGSNRRYTVAAIALPFLFLVMSGLARANVIIVNTLDGGSDPSLCTLPDAITSANTGSEVGGCIIISVSGADEIAFDVTGTIFVDAGRLPLSISDHTLEIIGPDIGGVTIDGGLSEVVPSGGLMFVTSLNKFLELENLTFAHGFAGIRRCLILRYRRRCGYQNMPL